MAEAYDAIPTYGVEEERQDGKLWRAVVIGEQEHRINMKIIEPYMRVISHGGEADWLAAVSLNCSSPRNLRTRQCCWDYPIKHCHY